MRRFSVLCLTAAAVMAPAVQAGSLDSYVEPAMVMNMQFGGTQRSEFNMGLRLNYATSVRQSLGTLSASPDTALEAVELRGGSHFFTGPALTQFDFNRTGFHKASLMGRTLVTKRLRLNQDEEVAEEGMEEGEEGEAPAEDAAWYDYEQWGWAGWGLAAAGAVGVYLLVEDDDDEPSQASSQEPPEEECTVPNPITGECVI